MKNIIQIFFLLLIVSCKNNSKEINSAKPEEKEKTKFEELDFAYEQKNYEEFFKLFPNTFEEFIDFFGYDDIKGGSPLYSDSHEYVSFLYIRNDSFSIDFLVKIYNISVNAVWSADAENSFQDYFVEYFMKFPVEVIDFLDNKSDNEIAKLFYFLMDGPCPDNSTNNEFIQLMSNTFGSKNKYVIIQKKQYNKLKLESEC